MTTSAPHLICDYKGPGKSGRKVGKIETNYLKLDISKLIKTAYHYDVTIDPDTPKKNLPAVFTQYCAENFPKIHIAFDGRKNAYAPTKLKLTSLQEEVTFLDAIGNNRTYRIKIQETNDEVISLESLRT